MTKHGARKPSKELGVSARPLRHRKHYVTGWSGVSVFERVDGVLEAA